ncbi:hypothetical protein [Paenibacillus naphthalenovorans]
MSHARSPRADDVGFPVLWTVIVVGVIALAGRRLHGVSRGMWSIT